MPVKAEPVAIKKYANRRLYNTGRSAYVTLDDLAEMIRAGDDFVVRDARSGEDITRSVLTQIIVEQEGKGPHLLPTDFLRELIRLYGDSLQALVPTYLNRSLDALKRERSRVHGHAGAEADGTARGATPSERPTARAAPAAHDDEALVPADGPGGSELDRLKRQLDSMKAQLDKLSGL
ncbi:MAG: polyhydroxyalkanoate synthesis repressor PhaR [Bauldia sp.]|nr:polyhydroxyalkanoate synthesis repressor PhaR [Bauldia sp.]